MSRSPIAARRFPWDVWRRRGTLSTSEAARQTDRWAVALDAPSILEPLPVSGDLRPVAADRHAAPPARVPSRVIGKQQCAPMTLARFHVGEVFVADKFRQDLGDGDQQ